MKNMVSLIIAAFAAVIFVSCKNDALEQEFGTQAPKTDTIKIDVPVYFDVTEEDTILLNEEGTPIPGLRPERLISKLTVDPEEVTVDKDMPWSLREESNTKVPNQNQLGGTVDFQYNHGKEVVIDSFYVDYKGRKLSFYRPKDLQVSAKTTSFEETSGSTHTTEGYTLTVKGIQKIFAKTEAKLNTQIGYKPSFERLLWGANHIKGTAKASYDPSKANIIVTCTDTLWSKAKWDNGEYKNELSTYTHSKHSFNVQISGTESVASISAIVGKDMSVSGNKATYAEVTLTLTEILNEIVEKNISYTYDGKTINWIDSLHYCSYQLDGAKYTTSSNVHVVLVRKSDNEKVSVDINKPLTEKEVPVTILRTVPVFSHVRYITNPAPQGNNVAIVRYDKVTAINYMSNGTQETVGSTEYPVTDNYSVSYTSNIQVENLQSFCGRYTLVNGAVTVQGYEFSTNLVSTVYGDAIVNGKNYKSQAPACPLTPIAVTISTNSLVYEYQGNHDGHNDIIKVSFPLSVTEKVVPHDPDFVGKIIYGWATDSYANGGSGVAARVGTDFHFVVLYNGNYTAYSREVGSTESWTTTEITTTEFARISASKPLAWTGTTPREKIGYIEQCVAHSSGNGYVIDYYTLATGTRSRVIGMSGATFTDEYRYPVQGTWANGKITVDGKVYTFTGTED